MKFILYKVWRWVRWPLLVIVVLFIAYVVWGLTLVFKKESTDAAVAAIHAQKITLADVNGTNLPPMPNQAENDATVAGIDKNNNGIRDDVELSIFKEYPNDSKVRAAELQYAMTEQMFLTRVSDTDTWKAVAEEDGRAFSCLLETYPRTDLQTYLKITNQRQKEVEDLVFNTQSRKNSKGRAFDFTTSFGDAPGVPCDIGLNTL